MERNVVLRYFCIGFWDAKTINYDICSDNY